MLCNKKSFSLILMFLSLNLQGLVIIGHRGACGYEPENTLRSFAKALELGVKIIEFDVHTCLTSEIMVMHDFTVDRTTNGTGSVANISYDKLRTLDAGKGEKIPTVQEVLNLVNKKAQVNIELKGHGTAPAVADIIHHYVKEKGWSYSDFIVSSFNHRELKKFNNLCPPVALGLIDYGLQLDPIASCKILKPVYFGVSDDFITAEYIKELHAAGVKVLVYTVNTVQEAERMIALGVDGIISNFPDKLAHLVN